MLEVKTERLGGVAVVQCQGRIVQTDDVFKMRDFVLAQEGARLVALDLSGVKAMGGGGLGMLAYLQNWTQEHEIDLRLVSPSRAVRKELARTSDVGFRITSPKELINAAGDLPDLCHSGIAA